MSQPVNLKRNMPHLKPNQQIGDFPKNIKTRNPCIIFPEWDLPPNDLKGKIHAVTQELKEYEIKLKGAQTEARKRRKILDKEWADLELKETEFKNTFIRYNKFVRENVEKRERWICKMKNDKISTENKEKQIEKLQTQYDHILSIKQKMESMIEKHLIYEDFLNKVVELAPNNFNSVDDVLQRYDVLLQAREFTLNRQEQEIKNLEETQAKMNHLLENKTFSIMAIANRIDQMQIRYAEAKKRTKHWEKILEDLKKHVVKSLQEISSVKSVAWELYREMCQRNGKVPEIAEWDVEHQLLYIKRTINLLENILTKTTKIAVKPKAKNTIQILKQNDEPIQTVAVWRKVSVESDKKSDKRSNDSSVTN